MGQCFQQTMEQYFFVYIYMFIYRDLLDSIRVVKKQKRVLDFLVCCTNALTFIEEPASQCSLGLQRPTAVSAAAYKKLCFQWGIFLRVGNHQGGYPLPVSYVAHSVAVSRTNWVHSLLVVSLLLLLCF